jgi:hypothetical protein
LSGCLSSQKADRQLGKIKDSYPEKVANYCDSSFPCNIVKIDTIVTIDTVPEIITNQDTLFDTVTNSYQILKYKYRYLTKYLTINKYYEDSAKLLLCRKENADLRGQIKKSQAVKETGTIWKYFVGLIIMGLLYTLKKKKKNEDTAPK